MDDERAACERRVGTTLRGKWTIDRLVGIGGMAAVYAATHKIGRREAIKILHPEVARSKDLRARFEREAQAVNRFQHPGVVEIRDIDVTEDGAPFLVMELLDGESLADRIQRLGSIEPGEMLRLMDELLDVLGAAHGQGIIHRDIKLDNLFVEKTGRLKVLDFGIARMRDGVKTAMRTRTGATLGTVSYMAPEQVRGISVDHRADLFAVGATMFRVIAKRRIHEARTESELLVKMATMAAPPLASVAPETPHGLCLVVDRALAFDRDRRYPDARTMQADVRALLHGAAPPHASARLAAGDVPSAGAPPLSPMLLSAAASADAQAEPPPRPAAPSGARWNEMGSAPAIGSELGPGSSGASSWEAATMAAHGAPRGSAMDAAQAHGGHPGMAQAAPGAPNGPPSALHNTGAGHAGAHGAPPSWQGAGAPHSAPVSLHNTGSGLHNTGPAYGAPAPAHGPSAPHGAPAHGPSAPHSAPVSLHNTGSGLHNAGPAYGALAPAHGPSAPHGAPVSLHNTGSGLHNAGPAYGAPAPRHSAGVPHGAPASLHNTGSSLHATGSAYGAPAPPHGASAPYGEQPAAAWAPRHAQPRLPPKLVIPLALGGVALMIVSVLAVWMALRDEPQSDAVQHDLLPAQSASAGPTQLSPSSESTDEARSNVNEPGSRSNVNEPGSRSNVNEPGSRSNVNEPATRRPDAPNAPASAPPASTFIIDLTKKKQLTRKSRQD
ncbi:Protein kinase [Sorangium cellulosum So ce56]|uniref:Protein kinase n=1 Tax=Sorangium cellulosum (strain So ce56) TaxID=448385 RepID=A9EZ28_SORC5|nr:serine/threonine-protein kinase [Sorangium cellulosum]CAN97597.1 Protein kinase [Sorangium cellulosum So ce56]